jgi:hypothetical protein
LRKRGLRLQAEGRKEAKGRRLQAERKKERAEWGKGKGDKVRRRPDEAHRKWPDGLMMQ